MITPYLKKLNTQGGTLYVFPSVSMDLTRTLVSNDYEFKFSHFACLNIPDIITDVAYNEDSDSNAENDLPKGLYLKTLMGDNTPSNWTDEVMGKAIVENLQNYVMNFETAILNGEGDDDDYDSDILTTVSEKVFWNWMQKVGAIKFTENGTEEVGDIGNRTVPYIGNLDVMNTVEINGDSFEELYIHIPSTAGASTNVYFRSGEQTDNKNYLNKEYVVVNEGSTGEYIEGRSSGDTHPNGYSIKSFVDIDTGGNIYVGDSGHTIDFRDSSYAGGDGIDTMNGESLENFEFNAILIYYDFYQKTNTQGVKRVATNLYGILFLDNIIEEEGTYRFQRYPKFKETIYGNGNSYALKIDLKVDTLPDTNNTFIDTSQNQPVSMSLYSRALTQLQNCIDLFYSQKVAITKLAERVSYLENIVMGIDSISSLKEDINRLYDICDSNGIVDTGAILGLIDANTKRLDGILNGEKDIKLQYDTDVLQAGNGINMIKEPNKVVISSAQNYSINTVYDSGLGEDTEINSENPLETASEVKSCDIKLKPGENFAVIYIKDTGNSPSDIKINIDDSDYNWNTGQSLKLHFVCLSGGSLKFENKLTNGIVVKLGINSSISVSGADFEGNDIIEIICINEHTNTFIHLIK